MIHTVLFAAAVFLVLASKYERITKTLKKPNIGSRMYDEPVTTRTDLAREQTLLPSGLLMKSIFCATNTVPSIRINKNIMFRNDTTEQQQPCTVEFIFKQM